MRAKLAMSTSGVSILLTPETDADKKDLAIVGSMLTSGKFLAHSTGFRYMDPTISIHVNEVRPSRGD